MKSLVRLAISLLLIPAAPAALDVESYLDQHPRLADAIRWRAIGEAQPIPFPRWSDADKIDLQEACDALAQGHALDLQDPPANLAPTDSEMYELTVIAERDARALYLAWIAHCIRVERLRLVPWSIEHLPREQLVELLSGPSFFHPEQEYAQGYRFWCGQHGSAVPAPPAVVWDFLRREGLIRETPSDTVLAVCEWSRRLTHFIGSMTVTNYARHWQYRGMAPISRMIEGTRYDADPSAPVLHYTAGCHGTAGWLKCLLRAVNIAVEERHVEGHATIVFPGIDRALSHGDDLYNQLGIRAPIESLLIDLETWDRWFGASVEWQEKERNIGRQMIEVARRHSSPFLEREHALDQQEARTRAQSRVYDVFKPHFSVEEVESAGVWDRLAQPISEKRD